MDYYFLGDDDSLKHDILKAFFILWGLILFIELLWFGLLTNRPHSTSEVIFAVTVIAVTSVFGSVGMYLFKSSRE
ncbi:hypothetical protein [Psychrobacillus sp. FJAT-21963]|uniref:hypothetical protein n=1 Tax=Psychrobacillus sp. FJAT-21963 TaxID=1712028 RepID=UPI0012E257D5|nr:hypothetical protein [Psychrobacillus sp. FJAT-21963]